MKEEDLEWFEENWNKGKTGRKAIAHSRSWKLANDIWDEPYEGEMSWQNARNGQSWKKNRKTQYKVKKVHKKKVRKPKHREHWRYKALNPTFVYRTLPTYYTYGEWWTAQGFIECLRPGDKIKGKGHPWDKEATLYQVIETSYTDWTDDDTIFIKARQLRLKENVWFKDDDDDEWLYDNYRYVNNVIVCNIKSFLTYFHQTKY